MSNGKEVLWEEILRRKNEFIGGQIHSAESLPGNSGVIVRGEIADIVVNGRHVAIKTVWGAEQDDGKWYPYTRFGGELSFSGDATTPKLYEDGGYEFGFVFVAGCQTLYPKDHPSNIRHEDIVKEAA